MKRNFKIKEVRIKLKSSYYYLKANINLLLLTSIFIIVFFAGCSDEITSNNSEQSNSTFIGEVPFKSLSIQPDSIMVWGDDTWGQISSAPQGRFKAVAGGSINGVALRWDNTPVLWGAGPIGPPPIPEALVTDQFRAITIGRDDVILIRQNKSLTAFGKNHFLANVPSGFYQSVTVAAQHAVAISDDGTLTAWGNDSYTTTNGTLTGLLNAPKGRPYIAVDSRVLYSLALHANGTLYGWGHGSSEANIFKSWTPTPDDQNIFYIPDQKFMAIAAGNTHALAILSNGKVTGWGNGTGGALNAPSHVHFKAVSAGWGFSIGLSANGTLWGWGTPFKQPIALEGWTFASEGWTRYNDTEYFYIPDKRFKWIAAAAFHIMAITQGS
jgi:hypothetical protein